MTPGDGWAHTFAGRPSCACPATGGHACWAQRYNLPPEWTVEDVEEDGGPCGCTCHADYDEGWADDVWTPADRAALDARIADGWARMCRRRFGRSSRAKQRRACRRRDIQLARKARRRGVCPCGDVRIDDPGPHLATCRYLNEEADECPF